MSKTLQITWFEIPVRDMSRAITFYEKVFDIKIHLIDFGSFQMGMFPASEQEGAAGGALMKESSYVASTTDGPLIYLKTASITPELDRVVAAGGKVLKVKTQISEDHGHMAIIIDSEGNRIALHSYK